MKSLHPYVNVTSLVYIFEFRLISRIFSFSIKTEDLKFTKVNNGNRDYLATFGSFLSLQIISNIIG